LIVLEAYACGVPVIGVPVGSIPEVMGEGFSSWIADDNHPPALAQRMTEFLDGRLTADPEALRSRSREFETQAVMGLHERVLIGQEAID
jgi:glycosyltransferase involved in cell wall biosynthesis